MNIKTAPFHYLSLFSGIGGFEAAIGDKGVCVAYAEIDKNAIKEYIRHYPHHTNLGDVAKITKKDIRSLGHIDIIVAGFPCNNLSSANHINRHGLDGPQSGLFWNMLKIIKWIKQDNKNLKIIIENNASMANKWRDEITLQLHNALKRQISCNFIDSSIFVPQQRRRYYWTVGPPLDIGKKNNTDGALRRSIVLTDILESPATVKHLAIQDSVLNYKNVSPPQYLGSSGFYVVRCNTNLPGKPPNQCCKLDHMNKPSRWKSIDNYSHNNFARCVTTKKANNILFDYRLCKKKEQFVPRYFSKTELCRLFGYPDNYVETIKTTVYQKLFGMSVVVPVIIAVLDEIHGINGFKP
jgi:DNA-cytosine methyltransferase